MKKHLVVILAGVTVLVVALAAIAQQSEAGRQRFQQRREAQMKAMEALQQDVAKLKSGMEEAAKAMQNRQNFQDMSEEERTKMREEFTRRRDEQQKTYADIEQQLTLLKGPRQLMTEHEESMAPLKEFLTSAQSEKATVTAAKIEQLIAQRQKQFEDKITAMGYTMEEMQRMGQRRGPQ